MVPAAGRLLRLPVPERNFFPRKSAGKNLPPFRAVVPGPAPAPAWPPLPVQRPAKISSDFPDEGFYARGLSSDSWYINAPL